MDYYFVSSFALFLAQVGDAICLIGFLDSAATFLNMNRGLFVVLLI